MHNQFARIRIYISRTRLPRYPELLAARACANVIFRMSSRSTVYLNATSARQSLCFIIRTVLDNPSMEYIFQRILAALSDHRFNCFLESLFPSVVFTREQCGNLNALRYYKTH